MRKRWACPDLGSPKSEGYENAVKGSQFTFPDCPMYYLRTAGHQMDAEHLVDGVTHPAELVAPRAAELEAGAISAENLSPKVLELAHLWLREKSSRREWEREQGERRAKVGVR